MSQPYDGDLDILGQQPLLRIYTQICSCYALKDDSAAARAEVVRILTNGLELLAQGFPWVAGQVVGEHVGDGESDLFKIVPRQEKLPPLVVKDLREDATIPSMEDLRRTRFPMNSLHEAVTCPRTTLPHPGDEAKDMPVFLTQATFIKGGLILAFVGQHQTMDMTGQGQVISLLAKACRNEPFTSEELRIGNQSRRAVTPLLEESQDPLEGNELARQLVKPPPGPSAEAPSPPPLKSSWASFDFDAETLASLKLRAEQALSVPFVSTDDTLSAFVWQSITRVRVPRLKAANVLSSTFGRAIDMRRFMNVSATYPGLLQNMAYSSATVDELDQEPLGKFASSLRSVLVPSDLARNTRSLITLLDRSADKAVANFTATLDLSSDLMLSSWAKLDSYDLDFNLGLGLPEAVRRPSFDPVESLLYLLPKSRDGEISVAVCLRDEDMEGLKNDAEFNKYCTLAG